MEENTLHKPLRLAHAIKNGTTGLCFSRPQGQHKFSGYNWKNAAISDRATSGSCSASASMNPLEDFEEVTGNFPSFLFIINRWKHEELCSALSHACANDGQRMYSMGRLERWERIYLCFWHRNRGDQLVEAEYSLNWGQLLPELSGGAETTDPPPHGTLHYPFP